MKKLLLFFLLISCKPESSIFEEEPVLICVDCFDQMNHTCYKDVFCGSDLEADKFIVEVETTAKESGILLYCVKY